METLDKTYFIKQSTDQAQHNRPYWLSKTPLERLVAAYRLSLRAYGYDPDDPPALEKSYYTKRSRP